MAATQQASDQQSPEQRSGDRPLRRSPAGDTAPLWLPSSDALVVEQAAVRPPDVVQGYELRDRVAVFLLGSRWKIATSLSTLLAVGLFIAVLPTLFSAGIGGLLKLALYQSWTVGMLLGVTSRVRSVSVSAVVRYWLAGMFLVTMAASFFDGQLVSFGGASASWISPIAQQVFTALPLGVAIAMGWRVWRHPGLSDFMMLGFALGAGYAFHQDALWGTATGSGVGPNVGLLVPSVAQTDGLMIVGHAVWTSIIGLALGLVLLHRHQPLALVTAGFFSFVVVANRLSIHADADALDWVRQLTFDGTLVAVIFVMGLVVAVVLDSRRQAKTAARDHLFPSDQSHSARPVEPEQEDLLLPMLTRRYRRRRNGVYNTIDASRAYWPPLAEARPAPLAELARLARAAQVAVGPETSATGWAPDPEHTARFRFVAANGFTSYPATMNEARVDDEAPPATGRHRDYWQYFGLGLLVVGLFTIVRLMTAGDPSAAVIETALGLSDGRTSPALIRGLLGATAVAISLPGRDSAVLGPGWEAGPPDDARPDRPDECEA